MKVFLPDKSELNLPDGATGADAACAIGPGLFKAALAVVINGGILDLNCRLNEGDEVKILTCRDTESLELMRHSAAHLMAQAVRQLFTDVKVAIGPTIEDGFYYDFDLSTKITPDDFVRIEARMAELVKQNISLERRELTREEAMEKYKSENETYKVDLIERLDSEKVSIYQQGDFTDLCRGPHLPSTGKMGVYKLLTVAGAYWRGNEKNPMLQRIYGTAFFSDKEMQKHLWLLEEAAKRDHRRLGRELDLFSIHEEAGAGLIYWHPRGARIRNAIESFWRNAHYRNGYELLYTPHLGKSWLWETSGHLEYYGENMYAPMNIDQVEYYVKPMNCPFHILIYKTRKHSYRELPLRWAELGTVYRYEKSGVLHGLMRVRGFTQDDAHIFCREDQLENEVMEVLRFVIFVLKSFGFQEEHYQFFVSTRPEKYVGEISLWEKSTNALMSALDSLSLRYSIDHGEGVFYGPKIDLKIRDSLKRVWQCSTIQVDFNNPQRFDLVYVGEDGQEHRPIMIHRALMGSLERFFAMLLEHYGGDFPLWLAPVQLRVVPVSEKYIPYGKKVVNFFREQEIHVELDERNEKIGYKIREAEMSRIPYVAVVGEKEENAGSVALRKRKQGEIGSFVLAQVLFDG